MHNSTKGKPVMVCLLSGLDKFKFSGGGAVRVLVTIPGHKA